MVVKKDKKSKPSGAKKEQKNGKAKASSSGDQPKLDAAALEQISAIRSKIHETFGKVAFGNDGLASLSSSVIVRSKSTFVGAVDT